MRVSGEMLSRCSITGRPPPPGHDRSSATRSGRSRVTASTASPPERHPARTSRSASSSIRLLKPSRTIAWSSTRTMLHMDELYREFVPVWAKTASRFRDARAPCLYHAPMHVRLPEPWRGPLLGLLYLVVWLCLWPSHTIYWNLAAGWRLGMLLLCPPRHWPWLIGAEWAGIVTVGMWPGHVGNVLFVLGDMPDILVVALCVAIARSLGTRADLHSPELVVRLLATALFVALTMVAVDAALIVAIHPEARLNGMWGLLGGELLGEYLGMLLVPPVLVLPAHAQPRGDALRRLLFDAVVFLLPALAVLLPLIHDGPPLSQFARSLALAPVLFFAFRHGWRGAASSMLVLSVAMTVFATLTHHLSAPAQANLV